jgi:hypothetical protein
MRNHDENKDINCLKRICYINVGSKTIQASRNTIIGIKSWARIDYLVHYCKYHFIWNNDTIVDKSSYENSSEKKNLRAIKKASKEHMLADKTKRTSNKK